MARRDWTGEELIQLASEVEEVGRILRNIAVSLEDHQMPSLFIHGDSPVNRYLPGLRKWARSIEVDRDEQVRAFAIGKQSVSRKRKTRSDQLAAQKPKKGVTK